MRILTGVTGALILTSSPAAGVVVGDENQRAARSQQQQIEELRQEARALQEKIEALEVQAEPVGEEQPPAAHAPPADPEPRLDPGLEARLDEIIHRSPTSPLQGYEPRGEGTTLDGITWGADFSFRSIRYLNFPTSPFGTDDDTLTHDQTLGLYFGGSLSENTRVKAEIRDSRVWGKEPEALLGDSNLTLNQAYLEIDEVFDSPFNLRIGRQRIEHGSERIFGQDEWFLQRTNFDGITAVTDINESTRLHLHALRLNDSDSLLNNELSPGAGVRDDNVDLFGLYASNTGKGYGTIEGYYFFTKASRFGGRTFETSFGNADSLALDGNRSGRTLLSTLGVRAAGGPHDRQQDAEIDEGVWWDLEAAKQFGTRDGEHLEYLRANNWFGAARLGYRLASGPFRGVYAGYDYVEGGRNPFAAMFPSTHGTFGILDIIGWNNVQQVTGGLEFSLLDNGDRLTLSYHILRLENGTGFTDQPPPLGPVPGPAQFQGPGPFPGGNSGGDKELGQELDVVYSAPCPGGSQVGLGVGIFFPGNAYTNAFDSHHDVLMAFLNWGIGF